MAGYHWGPVTPSTTDGATLFHFNDFKRLLANREILIYIIDLQSQRQRSIKLCYTKDFNSLQYSHLFANWEVVYTEAEISEDKYEECGVSYCYEPIHILEKPKKI